MRLSLRMAFILESVALVIFSVLSFFFFNFKAFKSTLIAVSVLIISGIVNFIISGKNTQNRRLTYFLFQSSVFVVLITLVLGLIFKYPTLSNLNYYSKSDIFIVYHTFFDNIDELNNEFYKQCLTNRTFYLENLIDCHDVRVKDFRYSTNVKEFIDGKRGACIDYFIYNFYLVSHYQNFTKLYAVIVKNENVSHIFLIQEMKNQSLIYDNNIILPMFGNNRSVQKAVETVSLLHDENFTIDRVFVFTPKEISEKYLDVSNVG